MLSPLQLSEANEQYCQLEERVEYVRSLHDLIRNHCALFIAENETLDIAVRDHYKDSFNLSRPPSSLTTSQLSSVCPHSF
jgi:hypothetical protein